MIQTNWNDDGNVCLLGKGGGLGVCKTNYDGAALPRFGEQTNDLRALSAAGNHEQQRTRRERGKVEKLRGISQVDRASFLIEERGCAERRMVTAADAGQIDVLGLANGGHRGFQLGLPGCCEIVTGG